jgi:D-alanine-D-alanine ligase
MRVCLLTTQKLDQVPFAEDDWPCDPRPFLPEAEWKVVTLRKLTAVRKLIALSRQGFDLFFNLCDGAWDESSPGVEVVQTLERLNLPFTGGTPDFYEPSREAMKRACRAWGLDTPDYAFARDDDEVAEAGERLRFPLFVKHPSSYASVGLTRDSRVETPGALLREARKMMKPYGAALIEEFVEGEEATVLVAENAKDPGSPITYTPVQYRFPEGESFKHSDMKWVDYSGMEAYPVKNRKLDRLLRETSARFFLAIGGAGYGRVDIRIDAEGRAQVLEINANCGLYYPPADAGGADLALAHDPSGHEGFTRDIVAAAFARHERRQRGWEVRPAAGGQHGLFTTRGARKGQALIEIDEQSLELVTRASLKGERKEARKDWLRRHAWPLSDELLVSWGKDPDHWTPIRHSCEPSAWWKGLTVVARRALKPGEEITLDFATFHDELMPAFDCDCGAEACRGVIRGRDHLGDFVARYGRHLSEHVRRRRREKGKSKPAT